MMKKKKGYRNGGKIKGMMNGGRMKAKGMKNGGKMKSKMDQSSLSEFYQNGNNVTKATRCISLVGMGGDEMR